MIGSVASLTNPAALERLHELLMRSRRPLVLTGAGCSTDSGIPDYRDAAGAWKRKPPVTLQDYLKSPLARQRYWARSLAGWPRVAAAAPGEAHRALARLEAAGRLHWLITQNVDGLHQRAGSRRVTDLHGRLDQVQCLECGFLQPRAALQDELVRRNPGWPMGTAQAAPDGDADLEGLDFAAFRVPDCPRCGGLLKPTVVFFGEQVPAARVEQCYARLAEADALLVVGSSLMVWSGYRFVRAACQRGLPVAVINLGRTRADAELTVKVELPCGQALAALAERLVGAA
mgnify:CR=1 FL=1